MAFRLSGKLVALHLDNSTGKVCLCYQGGTASTFHSILAYHVLNVVYKCLPTHLNVDIHLREG